MRQVGLLFLSLVLVLAPGGCSRRVPGLQDSTVPPDGAGVIDVMHPDLPLPPDLPSVRPPLLDCKDITVPAGRRCIKAGWFAFSKLSTARSEWPDTQVFKPLVPQPTYLDAFLIDTAEVTVAQYHAYLKSSGRAPPADLCGYVDDRYPDDPGPFYGLVNEVSGWTAGQPGSEYLTHPVVCVTRAEAMAYCQARGGRLPSVVEWMKAGRGPYPDRRRFPWGDEPPELYGPWSDGWWFKDYSAHYPGKQGNPGGEKLFTRPSGGLPKGASPQGVLGLVDNASELLADCGEDLITSYGKGTSLLIRPQVQTRQSCSDSVMVGGANWRSLGSLARNF